MRAMLAGRGDFPGALAILAGHEVAMEEGFAPRLMSQVEIAQAMGHPTSVGGPAHTASWKTRGLRAGFPMKGTGARISLSFPDKGRANAQAVRDQQRRFAEDTLSCLTENEKDQLAALVLKLNAALS